MDAATLCIANLLHEEGGFQNAHEDSGNWTGGKVGQGDLKGTKYGISAAAYPDEDIEHLTIERATELYRRDYWARIQGDALPVALAMVLLDAAVNSGVHRAVQWLQICLGVESDGILGPRTLAQTHSVDVAGLVGCVSTKRLVYDRANPKWAKYGNGWGDRIARVEKAGLALA